MAHPSAPSKLKDLRLRSLSAAVLLPPVAAALWLGGWSFAILMSVFAGLMAWEWSRLCQSGRTTLVILCIGATLAPSAAVLDVGLGMAIVACVAAVAAIAGWRIGEQAPVKLALGLPYVAAGGVAAVWLRGDGDDAGLAVLVWLVALVIVTDIAAYFVGRRVGGPKLAPQISPNKTWSGCVGGVLGAALVGLGVAHAMDSALVPAIGLSMAFSVVAQAGDLFESGLKRHFQVKDASNLIPGHGGFLDRLDGYLTALPAAALMTWTVGGSLWQWQ